MKKGVLRDSLMKFRTHAFNNFPKLITKLDFRRNAGYWPNLKNPVTFNEKLTWLKLYWRDPLAIKCADKYDVREFIRERGLADILIDLYGVYDNVEDIDFEQLPTRFALKVTHGCGYNVICTDKEKLNWEEIKRKIQYWQGLSYYDHSLEWIYKDIKPKIICEKFIETSDGKPPKDYKVFCFNGEPEMLFVASDRINNQTKFDFYTSDWGHIPVKNHYPNSSGELPRPAELEQILEMSRKLSDGFPHVRVDFYIEEGRIIFGEMTFFHFSGNQPFEPFQYDIEFGKYLTLPY
jgi:hypothetical protein